jgi:hypothetical protein
MVTMEVAQQIKGPNSATKRTKTTCKTPFSVLLVHTNMFNNYTSRNPWSDSLNDAQDNTSELKKSIREQKILLAALTGTTTDDEEVFSNYTHHGTSLSIEELKRRITSISKEITEKQHMAANRGRSKQSPAQWWARYQLNIRQLQDIADQRQTLLKELEYLTGSSIKNLEAELIEETEKLNQYRLKSARIKKAAYSPSCDMANMTESERIRAKAQAMVAARLNKPNHTTPTEDEDERDMQQANVLIEQIRQTQQDIESIIANDLSKLDDELVSEIKQLKDRQMFEQGLYIDDQVARFIDNLKRSTLLESRSASLPPPPPPPLSSYYSQPPPPIPTSQRPGTPRSEADIKAEAHKRIEERRLYFFKDNNNTSKRHAPEETKSRSVDDSKISLEERAAQERMRQAEAEARARLEAMREKRNNLRREAAEAEEKKRKAALEASAAAEAQMMAEKKRKQLEEEERLARIRKAQNELAEQQRKQHQIELERLRLEQEEKQKKEAEEREKREQEERRVEEIRQKKAREAAEQAAREKRLRRIEIERREKEIEAARLEEMNRRLKWEEAENQKRLEEERRIKEKEEAAARVRKRLEEEEAKAEEERRLEEEERKRLALEAEIRQQEEEKRLQEQKRLEEQRIYEAEQKLLEDKRLEEEKQRQLAEREVAAAIAAEEAKKAASEAEYTYSTSPVSTSFSIHNSTTAGTSGYGVDVEDEVNFGTSK